MAVKRESQDYILQKYKRKCHFALQASYTLKSCTIRTFMGLQNYINTISNQVRAAR